MLDQTTQIPLPRPTCEVGKDTTLSPKTDRRNIAALDGVRALAALMVVTLHLNEIVGVPWQVNQDPILTTVAVFGRVGVDLFFVLSGFLLFLPYAKALLFQEKWPSARTFYIRRICRIWPGYYLALFAMIFLFDPQYLQPSYWERLSLFLTFYMDSSPQTWQQLNGPFWTLATEWQFYVLLPLIALCFFWIVRRFSASPQQRLKAVLGCCVGLITWGLVMKGFGVYCLRHPDWTILVPRRALNIFLFFTFGIQGKYLEVFALGMIVCACYTYAQHPEFGSAFKARLLHLSSWIWKIGIVVLVCLALWHVEATAPRDVKLEGFSDFTFLNPLTGYFPWLGEPIAGVGFAACILAILFGSSALRWFFETRFLRWIGTLSYSLYIWHQRLIGLFYSRVTPHLDALMPRMSPTNLIFWNDVIMWLFVFFGIIPFCYILYKVIEEPGIRLGAWLTTRKFEHAQFFLPIKVILTRIHRQGL